MRYSQLWRRFAVVVGLLCGLPGCGGASECPYDGVEGCACAAQGVCVGELKCVANFCVSPGASQATGEPTGDDSAGQPECAAGLSDCGGDCVDVQGHPEHCGVCDKVCPNVGVCIAGQCAAAVDCSKDPCPGYTYCDPSTQQCLAGCGLDTQCDADEQCDMATHACGCPPGFHECGDACVSDSDVTACGAGCEACPAAANGEPACIAGACKTLCAAGHHECGGQCYLDEEEVICESNRPTCTVCPNAMGAPAPACDANDQCTYECPGASVMCGDLECKVAENDFCSEDEDCCVATGFTCQFIPGMYFRCIK